MHINTDISGNDVHKCITSVANALQKMGILRKMAHIHTRVCIGTNLH